MITTADSEPAARSCLRVSRPSIPGSHTSSRMQPYARLPTALRQSSPLATASAAKPSSSITARSVSRIPRSSSTMSIESMNKVLSGGRKFDQESGSARIIFLGANAAAVFENYLLNDRETQTGAAVAPREVWLKEAAKITRLDSLARVRDLRIHHASFGVVAGRDRDTLFIRGEHGFDCVVNQVYKDAFDLFDVE